MNKPTSKMDRRALYPIAMKIGIVVDHLRMGGAERVALDQAYQLSDDGHVVALAQFAGIANKSNPNYLTGELEDILSRGIKLLDFSGGHLHQLSSTLSWLKKYEPELLIVHSLRAAVIIKIAKFLIKKNIYMTVSIHQLPELSAPIQRYKRFLYAQSADRLFACSLAMQEQWRKETTKYFFSRILFRKKIELVRNGVYLARIRSVSNYDHNSLDLKGDDFQLRVISLGRNVAWKRADILVDSFESVFDKGAHLLIMRPEKNDELEDLLSSKFGASVKFMYGKTISDLIINSGDVHLYPTDSGRHSQSSINLIEMSCLGIPSLVSPGGGQGWPELLKIGLIVEVNWKEIHSVKRAITTSANSQFSSVLSEVRELLSIKRNISEHLGFLKTNV